jgi:hypothetical protein
MRNSQQSIETRCRTPSTRLPTSRDDLFGDLNESAFQAVGRKFDE